MTITRPSVETDYASGYAKGRHAAKAHIAATMNPFARGSSAFRGWNDGHYDEQSARTIAIERHSAFIWNRSDDN